MSAIRLCTFLPQYFNQNGEQANLTVLQRWIEMSGTTVQVREVSSKAETKGSAFLLIGDASRNTLLKFGDLLTRLASEAAGGKGPLVLVLGKSFDHMRESLTGSLPREIPRVSEFRQQETELGTVRGYLNARVEPQALLARGSLFGSSFHGPLLASSPSLRAHVLQRIGAMELRDHREAVGLLKAERELGWV